jgi:hypothetical protein
MTTRDDQGRYAEPDDDLEPAGDLAGQIAAAMESEATRYGLLTPDPEPTADPRTEFAHLMDRLINPKDDQ